MTSEAPYQGAQGQKECWPTHSFQRRQGSSHGPVDLLQSTRDKQTDARLWTVGGECTLSDTTVSHSRSLKPWSLVTRSVAQRSSETGLKPKDVEFGCKKKGNTTQGSPDNDMITCPVLDLWSCPGHRPPQRLEFRAASGVHPWLTT